MVDYFYKKQIGLCTTLQSNATHLDQLDNYTLLAIFDQMDLTDLMNVANISIRFRQLIIDHFMLSKHRIHEKVIKIAIPRDYTQDGTKLIFRHPETILPFLRNFGHLISKIEFAGSGFIETAANQIVKYIEQYSSESLHTIKQYRGGRYFFSSQTKPFSHVKVVDIECRGPLVDYQLHRIYPKMESLKLLLEHSTESNVCAQNSEHLIHLVFQEMRDFANDAFLQSLIRANPQLRTLRLQKAVQPETMRVIQDHLPVLESLNLVQLKNDFFQSPHNFHLSSVHHFVFDVIHPEFDQNNEQFPITFNQLKTLRINSLKLHPQLIDLLRRNSRIKSLSMPMLSTPQLLLPILREMDELEEIHLWWSTLLTDEDLALLLNAAVQLKTATISAWSGESHRNLMSKIPEQWQHVKSSGDYSLIDVTLERKL